MECLREKQQEWCFRLDIEKRFSDNSFFVTLTYEDENLTFADGEPCLSKRDVQLFFKRLRKMFKNDRFKYYCVGEYGEQPRLISPKGRPHYHALIFYRGKQDWFTIACAIKELWNLGITKVLPVLGAQGYVTKYVMKFDRRDHLVPPFSLISRGLGIDYLSSSMVSYHHETLNNFALKPGGYRVKLPRYYMDKIFSTYERLLMKKRADLYRRKVEMKKLAQYDIMWQMGVNPFANAMNNYKNRLYQSLKLYKEKHRL